MKSHKELKPTLQQLGRNIYYQRVLKNMPTKEIAPKVSLSIAAYRNIEKGESDPSFTTLLFISKVLGVDFSELTSKISILNS